MDHNQAVSIIRTLYGQNQVIGFHRGVGGTIVVTMTDGYEKYVLKMGSIANLRNTIEEEISRRKFLLPHLEGHLPEVVMSGLKPATISSEIISQILGAKQKLWLSTARPYVATDCLRNYQKRADELVLRIQQLLICSHRISEFLGLPVIINGQTFPSFDQLINRLSHYVPSLHICNSHGDLNADNILILEDNWFLVDWEWAGLHDWIESISRICGWWQMMGTTLQEVPKITITNNHLQLDYVISSPSIVGELFSKTIKKGRLIAKEMGEKDFDKKLSYMLATYYLRDLHFQRQRGRQNFAIPAIGEAFKAMFTM